jgi:NTP pyrophosphatase (non-canonical NTP hydrolase)
VEFDQLKKRALAVRAKYAELERQNYGAEWTNEELALGFVGDVGDLAKLVMAENGRRNISEAKEKLAHELADCLWSVMVLAHRHQIDLERSFLKTMVELEKHIDGKSTDE